MLQSKPKSALVTEHIRAHCKVCLGYETFGYAGPMCCTESIVSMLTHPKLYSKDEIEEGLTHYPIDHKMVFKCIINQLKVPLD